MSLNSLASIVWMLFGIIALIVIIFIAINFVIILIPVILSIFIIGFIINFFKKKNIKKDYVDVQFKRKY